MTTAEARTPASLRDLANTLARNHRVVAARRAPIQPNPVDHLAALAALLDAAHAHFVQVSRSEEMLSGVAEWLLDNRHIVHQAVLQVRKNMPAGYYRRLPRLAGEAHLGLTRVYVLARAFIQREAGLVDVARLADFCRVYQQEAPLTVGEVWALPTMIRLALLEFLVQVVARNAHLETPAELVPALNLAPAGDVSDVALVGHAIRGLRTLAAQEWKEFFEDLSRVEAILGQDPAGIYARMDFDTRDHYRREVEALGRGQVAAEQAAATAAVRLAGEARLAGRPGPQGHVGYYLLDARGRAALEEALGIVPSLPTRLARLLQARALLVYLAAISLLTLALVVGLVAYAAAGGGSPWTRLVVVLVGLPPAATVAVNVVNLAVTRLLPPRTLPKMDFRRGIPAGQEAIVVIPSLLVDDAEVDSLLQQVERHYLANPDPRLSFALLTDLADAPQEEMPEDAALVDRARAGIARLNARYPRQASAEGGPFFLLHRRRQWNPAEGVWLGWERKRGKLAEFNRLLAGSDDTSYTVQEGNLRLLRRVRYVITLDADTLLPRESAQRLVGTLAHPLNRPQFDAQGRRVVAGYTVLQPRVEIVPAAANRSLFSRIFAHDAGVDLYTRAVSDVYQDLFGEGIFVGKGIYDVEAFARALEGVVPENALLSHDLFEGVHGRAGLVTDIVLYEDYPPSYLTYAQRLHRWARGDWQLLPWLWPRVPGAGGSRLANHLSALDRWKIVDNLRRSLQTPAVLLLLLAGWLWLPGSPLFWTMAALLSLAVPLANSLWTSLLRLFQAPGVNGLGRLLQVELRRWLLSVEFLPYEATIILDAVLTTLTRLFVTHRHLLQWTTHAHTVRLLGEEGQDTRIWRQMGNGFLLTLGLALFVAVVRPQALPVASPLLLAWLLSPLVAQWISRPAVPRRRPLTEAQQRRFRSLARRTWLFFERFAGPEDHWLPPDHYQEDPRGTVAHRTSPTNIGLLLATTQAAYELGYIGPVELSLRVRSTLDTLGRMERYRGHWLNWYETRGLQTLPPRYVSTVDSGNLAACLLILKKGIEAVPARSLLRRVRWLGLADTLDVFGQVVAGLDGDHLPALPALQELVAGLRRQVWEAHDTPERWPALLVFLRGEAWEQLQELLMELLETGSEHLGPGELRDLRLWSERLQHQLQAIKNEADLLLPWFLALAQPPAILDDGHLPEVSATWSAIRGGLPVSAPLQDLPGLCRVAAAQLHDLARTLAGRGEASDAAREASAWCARLAEDVGSAGLAASGLLAGLEQVAHLAETYFREMEFGFLFDRQRQVFYLGYYVPEETLDTNHYDLLASEARTASLIAMARGQVPVSHWLHLERPLGRSGTSRVLLSWNGSMFEYLMPDLFVRSYDGLLLAQTNLAAVEQQIRYARQQGVPWGISESGYYRFDANQNYQYRGFGVPGLGRKRGLDEDLVVSPYASLLALTVDPHAVAENLDRLVAEGLMGHFGLYEAVDYTPHRLPLGQKRAIVRSHMAHHQGMILVALANLLLDGVLVDYFHGDPRIQSVELLLQEQVPHVPVEPETEETVGLLRVDDQAGARLEPWPAPVDAPLPQAHFLSNGRYGLTITAAGAGFATWQNVDLTRWRADTTLEDWGTWIYIQDLHSGALISAGLQPVPAPGAQVSARFSGWHAELQRSEADMTARTEVTVAPQDDVEIRRVTLTNHTPRPRHLQLTSYAEVILAAQDTDRRHPAFNKLFIQSEYLPELNALLFFRRPRSAEESPVFLVHTLALPDGPGSDRTPATAAFETDRARFLGRGGAPHRPAALAGGQGLTGTTGNTLDPILALAQAVELPPHGSVQLAYLTIAAASRKEALDLARRYHTLAAVERVFQQVAVQAEAEARQLDLDTQTLRQAQLLLSALIYPHPALRAAPEILAENRRGQSGLWGYALSGDYPILLVHIAVEDDLELVRSLLQMHAYWRRRGLKIDLVVLNTQVAGYAQERHGQFMRLVRSLDAEIWLNQRGGIFFLQAGQVDEAGQVLLATAARVVLDAARGPLDRQLERLAERPAYLPPLAPTEPDLREPATLAPVPRPAPLQFDNGLGGFAADGREYAIYLEPGRSTPAPWINVVANPRFGFMVSESSLGSTWAANSGENRLTPWDNDPVRDAPHEVLYLRDEETGQVWSPTPQPAGADAPYLVRHGAGYTTFEHHSHGLRQRLRLWVAGEQPVKIVHLRLENAWPRTRRVTATFYAEWVLGVHRDQSQQYVVPEYDAERRAVLAHNAYPEEFGERVAFCAASKVLHGLTADRTEFLGRRGSYARPAALQRVGLGGNVRAGLDPCAALQVHMDLEPGASEEIYFLLGQGADREESLALVDRFSDAGEVEAAWHETTAFWDALLTTVQVQTPDAALDTLLNRWLLYQDLSCRIWARSAFYQPGGAYGFRDQLQDVMAVLHAAPDVTRHHILRAARHQFSVGDVLHWWHPPSGRGVRTRISDDLLWLPFVTAQYVETTGDAAILAEQVPFVLGEPLEPEQAERYGHWQTSEESYSLYDHCRRAIDRGATAGSHGLPLMGAGDWNDGMNRVGIEGRGESVWLGWFLYSTLTRFAPLCEMRGDAEQATAYRRQAEELRQALEAHAWDGDWYLRAYYDDGSPLGSAHNRECQIDSLAQSWAVLSGAGSPERSAAAMQAVVERLVRAGDGLVVLFAPPFQRTLRDPGYIKGYPPGIRENGGQYTHAALWVVWALAALGEGDRAGELLQLLNPIYHGDTSDKVERYRVEPYVVTADIYSIAAHTGRGGWSWYTGSGGWTYRLALEAILGFQRQGDRLRFDPCLPSSWPGFSLAYRWGRSLYRVQVENPDKVCRGVRSVQLDGELLPDGIIPLLDDGREHDVRVLLGPETLKVSEDL